MLSQLGPHSTEDEFVCLWGDQYDVYPARKNFERINSLQMEHVISCSFGELESIFEESRTKLVQLLKNQIVFGFCLFLFFSNYVSNIA